MWGYSSNVSQYIDVRDFCSDSEQLAYPSNTFFYFHKPLDTKEIRKNLT